MDLLHLNETEILIYYSTLQKNIAEIQVNWNKTYDSLLPASPKATGEHKRLIFETNNYGS